ncbi:hypothetical protein GCM10010191_78460 [Actinomadura vinacea]|uniref:Uncharacterized protein n=1 Tax=Actinomadura vinacea TaxID=115336 RepID=A0ABN3K4H3_9ACTN
MPFTVDTVPDLPAGFTDTFTSRTVNWAGSPCTPSSAVTARRCCYCPAGRSSGTAGGL